MSDSTAVEEPSLSRFVVGIDLGTTNCAVCYIDTHEEPWRVRTFRIPQLVAAGQIEARETLPSFHYQPAEGELAAGAMALPWASGADSSPPHAVGVFAREQGRLVPGRLVDSAKSWLCHSGVDRTAPLLPWHGAADVERLSPVEVSGRYLAHIRRAWDHAFPSEPLAKQEIVLTLPASFDEVARELTVKAARMAGLPRVILIEEPQAAFYAWLDAHAESWETLVRPGQKILVCDIGGGTSDFTLIRVRPGVEDKVQFHRVAVGDHLILGGDNLDLALAHHIERKLTGDGKLEPRQWSVLVRTCRQVKETLLAESPPEKLTVNLPGSGSKLIGGGLQVEVSRQEVQQLLVEGFLPRVGLDEKPQSRQSGFQEFGLPYAADAAITRYLAAFLSAHRHVALGESWGTGTEGDTVAHDAARPDIVLFNGGFFASPVLRNRLLEVLSEWFSTPQKPDWRPMLLKNERLDLAVAHGAAYYGMVRRGEGVRIAAGLARSYYIGVETGEASGALQAICLVPAGVEPGDEIDLSQRQFELRVSQPIEFPLFVSSTRLTDSAGEIVALDREQLTPLPPIRTVLKSSRSKEADIVQVALHARLTEIGTLDLSCEEVQGRRSWRLQFDVRSATQTDISAHLGQAETEGFVDEETWQACRELIDATFGPRVSANPERLIKQLGAILGQSRKDWPTSLLRNIWEELLALESGRRKSQVHEARWLNLLGFALRPGYGFALDDWRVAETWRALQGKLVHATPLCRAEWWILWRRIGGGLSAGQQIALATPHLATVRQVHKQLSTGRGRGADLGASAHESAEIWRLLGSFEWLPISTKIELGGMIVELLPKPKVEPVRPALTWALGRLGTREPLYGPLNAVVPAERAEAWARELIEGGDTGPMEQLAVMQLARRTGDRYRDVSESLRERILSWMERVGAQEHFQVLVRKGGRLESDERSLIFGESLPSGLRVL